MIKKQRKNEGRRDWEVKWRKSSKLRKRDKDIKKGKGGRKQRRKNIKYKRRRTGGEMMNSLRNCNIRKYFMGLHRVEMKTSIMKLLCSPNLKAVLLF